MPEALGLSTREWVDERLGGYVRLSIPERREAVAELTAEGMSTRGIADILGVGQSTVDRDVDAIDPDGSDEEEEVAEEAESDDAGDPDGSDESVSSTINLSFHAAAVRSDPGGVTG